MGKGDSGGNKKGTGKTISLYLKAEDMELLRLVLGKDASDDQCIDLARKAAKAGINSLLLPEKSREIRRLLGGGEREHACKGAITSK